MLETGSKSKDESNELSVYMGPRRKKNEGMLKANRKAVRLERLVRAVTGSCFETAGHRKAAVKSVPANNVAEAPPQQAVSAATADGSQAQASK